MFCFVFSCCFLLLGGGGGGGGELVLLWGRLGGEVDQ